MSSICLAMTTVSFGVAASARRTQPANGAAAAPASNRRLVISVMAAPLLVRGWLQYAACMPYTATIANAGRLAHQKTVIPTGAERSEAQWRDLLSVASATREGPSATPPLAASLGMTE